jgi:hypothetical protein
MFHFIVFDRKMDNILLGEERCIAPMNGICFVYKIPDIQSSVAYDAAWRGVADGK